MLLSVDLVNDQDDWLLRFAQHLREFLIERGQSLFGIDEKKQEVAIMNRFFDGMPHLPGQFRFAFARNPASIPHNERLRSTRADGRDSITGYARLIVHDRDLATNQAIE